MSQPAQEQPTDAMGFPRLNILDSVIHVLTGTPDAMLTPAQQKERSAKRQDAYASAVSAQQNPGAEFMGPPKLSGGDSIGLGDIIKLIAGGGG